MTRCVCGAVLPESCECRVDDTACIQVPGSGIASDPYRPRAVVNSGSTNIASCGPDGLLVLLDKVHTKPPSAKIVRSTDQEIEDNSDTYVFFDTVAHDNSTMFDPLVDAEGLFCPRDGIYLMQASARFDRGLDTGQRRASLVINESLVVGAAHYNATTGDGHATGMVASSLWHWEVGQSLKLRVYQNQGADIDLIAKGPAISLSATYLAPEPS